MLNATHAEILKLLPEIRRTIASVLRTSRYYGDDHIDECMSEVMLQALDYGTRTFDPNKGSAKSHFTTFAKMRARNWLYSACRRYEVADQLCYEDGDTDKSFTTYAESMPAEGTPQTALIAKQDAEGLAQAIDTLDERSRSLVSAFLRLGSWFEAAAEIGVSPATASRMKASIAAQLR